MLGDIEIMTIVNSRRLDQDDYASESPVKGEATVTFFSFPIRRIKHGFYIEETVLEREDNIWMAIAGFTSIDETYFSINPYDFSTRTYRYNERLQI